MRHMPHAHSRAIALHPVICLKSSLLLAVLLAAIFLCVGAQASTGLCSRGSQCSSVTNNRAPDTDRQLLEFGSTAQLQPGPRRHALSNEEYFSFSGVGAIVCTVDGRQKMSTAFLVGTFDLAVTVAHTFEGATGPATAESCIYTSTDSLGQIRERIPVSYVKSEWEAESGAAGHIGKDLAVVRLSAASHYAQRTMPLGRFSGHAAPVVLVGFRSDLESDPLKSKARGTVYERKLSGTSFAPPEGFAHDIDARGIASGAPVIDEKSGVIIGIHTVRSDYDSAYPTRRNTMITMNEWLEETLRAEMQASDEKGADSKL
jgi:V8-like Glu-specific endopeptidase